ncbi:NosD domain-containing protein [Chloroflexota bacterium]
MKKYFLVLLVVVLIVPLVIVAGPTVPVKAVDMITVPGDQPTIQAAIAAAGPGDTIFVGPGIYTETLIVGKPVILMAAENVTVAANLTNQPVFNVTANKTTITGFTITGANLTVGILLDGAQATITNNYITGHKMGIYIRSGENRITRNTISNNTNTGIGFNCGMVWNHVEYNDISGNTIWGATGERIPDEPYWMQYVGFNYWGDPSGPGGDGPGEGDNVNRQVWYNPWLNTPSQMILDSGIADISIAVPLEVGWNTLATPMPLTTSRWDQLSFSTNYTAAYAYDTTTGFSGLATDNDTYYLDPLEAVFVQMTQRGLVTFSVSTAVNPPGTKVLKQGWNLMGSAMSITERELEMWKVLISVANTPTGLIGYNMVVSPPLATQPSWVYVRGQEERDVGFRWEKMDFGRGYWIYMENQDELAGFSSTPITAKIWD